MLRILACLIILLTTQVQAANWYVHKGASGTNAGTSWTNAWNEMNQINWSSVACGDTVWWAGGTYTTGADIAVSKVCTASTIININRVLSTDAVPVAAAGWSSAYDSQVILPNINVEGPQAYINFNGRAWQSGTLGSGGIQILIPGTEGDGIDGGVHSFTATAIDHITWQYVEIFGPACVETSTCTGGGVIGVNIMPFCPTTAIWTNLLFDHVAVHRTGEAFRGCGQNGTIVQYGLIYDTHNDGPQHEDILYSNPPYQNVTWRYNKIFMSPNDGLFFEGTDPTAAQNFAFYGNSYYHSGGSLMSFKTETTGTYGPVFIYNNTFENDNTFGDFQPGWLSFNNMASGSAVKNNVFENINSDAGAAPPNANGNAYSTAMDLDSGANSFHYAPGTLGSSVMFVNESTGTPIAADFHLTTAGMTAFQSGLTLTTPYNVDPNGITRGSSGHWYVGAFDIPPQLAIPMFQPGASSTATVDTFNSPFPFSFYVATGTTVCSTATPGLTGTAPSAGTAGTCDAPSTAYTSGFAINGTVTLEALTTQVGQTNSAVKILTFVIPPFWPVPGPYSYSPNVQLSGPQGTAAIIYTTNGSSPAFSGTCTATNGIAVANNFSLSVPTTTTVKFTPCVGGVGGTMQTGLYTINGSVTTWYIRADGGTRYSANVTSGQCNGKFDVSYSSTGGSGTNQNCAYNDFRYLWDDNSGLVGQGAWVISGGDTVIVRGCAALAGQVNPDNPHCRIGWDKPIGSGVDSSWCYAVGNSGCYPPTIPAGSPSQHTRFLGQNYAACNTGGATNPKDYASNLTQIFGGFALAYIMNVKSTANVDFQCLEITAHNATVPSGHTAWASGSTYVVGNSVTSGGIVYDSIQAANTGNTPATSPTFWRLAPQCTTRGAPSYPTGCNTSQPLDDFASTGFYFNSQSSNITLQDVYIHGLNQQGSFGPIGGAFNLTRVFVGYNPFAGLNFDDGFSTPDAPGSSIVAKDVMMIGNGCQEQYPIVNTIPMLVCYDTNTGGFGDSWSGQSTTLDSFSCDNCQNWYNTKDAFIGPHTWITTLTIKNSISVGNMGANWKWGGSTSPNNTTFTNNLTVGNCTRMSAALPGAPANYNQYLGGFCRAAGNVVASVMPGGSTWTIANSTWVSYMPTEFLVACPTQVPGGCPSTLNFINNIFLGYFNPNAFTGSQLPALYLIDSSITTVKSHNVEFGMRNWDCPAALNGNVCADPKMVGQPAQGTLASESVLDNFNFHLTSTSPAIGAGASYTGLPATDYGGSTTTSPSVVGAFNFASATLSTITVSPSIGTLFVGGPLTLVASCLGSDGLAYSPCTVVWSDTTSAHSVINSVTGVVTGTSSGTDTKRATISTIYGEATVIVSAIPTTRSNGRFLGRMN